MRIAFEGVSFAYANPERAQAKALRKAKRREAGLIGESPSLADHGDAAWGTDPEEIWALRDISLVLSSNEIAGLAGHTGSGKSTLIQLAGGLLHPTRGRVLADGEDLADKKAFARLRGKIGVVFQYPENQLFAPTVLEDVAFGPRNLGLDGEEAAVRVRRALQAVHLDANKIGHLSPFELSGGQQRRVALAGVIAMEPAVLVLDEPMAGLDPVTHEELLALLGELRASGIGIVLVSHSMDDLARIAERIIVLSQGRVFSDGTPAEVFSEAEELRSIGLGVPAAQRLAMALREQGFRLPRPLYDAKALADDLAADLGATGGTS